MNNDNRKSRIAMKLSAALITTTALTMAVSAAGYANYVVQPGDNLTSIARAHNTTVSAIVSANNLKNADLIYVAQRLAIPTGHHVGGPVHYQPVLEATVSDVQHTVVAGDTLNKLAAKYNTTVAYLASANGICNVNVIDIGQVLNIGKSVTYTQMSTTPTVSEYTVVAGDTLNNIARKFNTSARHLAAVNNISDINVIHVGQVLNVGYSTGYYHSYTVRSASGAEMTDSEFEALADMPAVEAGATVEAVAVVAETPVAVEAAEVYEVEVEVEAVEIVEEVAFAVEIPVEEITLPEFVEEVEEEAGFEFEPEPEVELPVAEVVEDTTPIVEETLAAEAEPEVAFNEYRVTETSSVFHLAALFNTTVAELLQWNSIPDTNNIPAGTVLQVSV